MQMYSLNIILHKTLEIIISKICEITMFQRFHILSQMLLLYFRIMYFLM